MLSLADLAAFVKGIIERYRAWVADPDLSAHRLCPCGFSFRHRHGQYWRDVTFPPWWVERVPILRLKCPACGRTESIIPLYLRRHSPYPWLLQELCILGYLAGPEGYRRVADQAGIAWPLLWQWVDLWARRAAKLYTLLAQDLLIFAPEMWEEITPEDEQVYAAKARSEEKRRGLAWLAPVLRLGQNLRRALATYFPERGSPSVHHIFAFLANYLCQAAPPHPT